MNCIPVYKHTLTSFQIHLTSNFSMAAISDYFRIKKSGHSQAQLMGCYLGGSAVQTIVDNPVTAYRQLVQQYSKGLDGKMVDPKIAQAEANAVFKKSPFSASLSGLGPRLVGVGGKRIPKFGFLLGISFVLGEDGVIGPAAAMGASILSAPFINPIRMIEKQQRAFFRETGKEKAILEILRESKEKQFKPLFRGTSFLVGHSMASALLGLAGQPKLQKYIQQELKAYPVFGLSATNFLASALVSPIYVIVTNPLSRLEVITQTASIKGKSIGTIDAVKELVKDTQEFGLRGMFRGNAIGIGKAVISLWLFHEARLYFTEATFSYNQRNGLIPF